MSTNRSAVRSHGPTSGYPPGFTDPSSEELMQSSFQLNQVLERIERHLSRLEQRLNAQERPEVGTFDEPEFDDDDELDDEASYQHQAVGEAAHGRTGRRREPWLWIGGDTKPHKDLLKAEGGRWSPKHGKWYFINRETLPASLAKLRGISWEVTE